MSAQSTVVNLNQTQEREIKSESLFSKALRRLRRDYITMGAMGIVLLFTVLSIAAPLINTYILNVDPNTTSRNIFAPIGTPGHILGTDDIGRDQLARLLVAGQVSLGIGFAGAAITLTVGLIIGVITGYFGGIIDDILNWVITTLDSIPSTYLLIMIAAVFRPDAASLILTIALISWTGVTRIIRGQTLSIRNLDYVLSAKALGASSWRIMFNHIVPNLISITAIVLMRAIGNLMLIEAGLSFLGLGVQPPQATWGNMLTKAQQFFTLGGHLIIAPGLAIWITVLCLYVIGDGIRDAFDPTSNK
jgi:peptide/nickel transport system permease protein